MRMAKTQKATLDPSKISGYCGRLKCCLRFEDKTYSELKKNLPKRQSLVETPNGKGKVVELQIFTQLVVVEYESGETAAVPVEDIKVLSSGGNHKKKKLNNNRTQNGVKDQAKRTTNDDGEKTQAKNRQD